MLSVYFRTDGNAEIGHGHLVRCLALADMLAAHFSLTFFCKTIPESVGRDINAKGYTLKIISGEDEFIQQITASQLVVIDGYHFDAAYRKAIKCIGATVVCIDDIPGQFNSADLIINHTEGVKATDYKADLHAQFALGFDYALLRKSFLSQPPTGNNPDRVETIFISFGGSDSKNITETAVLEALKFGNFKTINVVTGASYANKSSIDALAQSHPSIKHYNNIGEEQLRDLMVSSGYAIVPASGMLLEAISCKCRVISGMYVSNQQLVYTSYKSQGIFTDAGNFDGPSIMRAIEKAWEQTSDVPVFVDGKSGERLLKLFKQLAAGLSMLLRPASADDLMLTYKWAANPQIRAFSFNNHTITIEEHTAWFTSKLTDVSCLYFIAMMHNEAVGSIRFDLRGNEAIISYLIAPEFHGLGLGQIILARGIEKITSLPQTAQHGIIGYVLPSNIPSLKAFRRFAFNETVENNYHKFELLR